MLDDFLCFRINMGCCLIQNQNLRICSQGPGKTNQLAFATGIGRPFFKDGSLNALRQTTDHILGPNPLKGLPDSRIINGLIPHGHIRSNSAGEKIRVLKHNPHFLADTFTGIVANGLAINENLAFLGVIEAEQEINHRTLTRPRMSHQCNGLTWLS